MAPLPAGIMPDFRDTLPDLLKENYSKWVWHEPLAPGVYRHLTAEGVECITVRVQLPPGGLLSAETLRLFSGWIREYAQAGRYTSRQGFELVGVIPGRLTALLSEIRHHGFAVGGTGRSLHQLKGCNGFIHCQNAAVDPPSIMKVLGDVLYDDLTAGRYPAPLKISVSGCPNQCGGAVEADIGISGVYLDPPEVDDRRLAASSPDYGLLCRLCPRAAVRVRSRPSGKSIIIRAERCIRCASCVMVAPAGIAMGPRRGVAIRVGGRGPDGSSPPRFSQVAVPYLPAEPPDYAAVVAKVRAIVALWQARARPRERIADYIDRVGWDEFLSQIGVEAEGT